MGTHFAIIGNGAAGYRAAKSLRRAEADLQISVFTDERYPFYLRRQLGDFLAGRLSLNEILFESRNSYRRERIDLFLMTRIERLLPASHEVVFASGQHVRYDRLLIATGSRAVPFEIPGISLGGVAAFDTLSDVQEARRFLPDARRAVILGEGVIGLTIAQSLADRGLRVTQLVRGERFWPEMLDETASGMLEAILEGNGVALARNTEPRAILGAGDRAIGIETTAGETIPADLVAAGCRRQPNLDLLDGAGIETGRGIRVNAALQTSQSDIFAAGDATEPIGFDDLGQEGAAFCWQRAWAQGGLAAASMLDRRAEPALEAVRIRTTVFGRDLAVIGHGNLAAGGDVEVLDLHDSPGIYRRLVFEKGLLVGAIVFGTGEWVHELNRFVAERAPHDAVAAALGLAPPTGETENLVPQTFAQHCLICAAELVIHGGTRIGSTLQCPSCNTSMLVRWDGKRGWLDVPPP
jgi:nitrite reductase (NADH) large subunit